MRNLAARNTKVIILLELWQLAFAFFVVLFWLRWKTVKFVTMCCVSIDNYLMPDSLTDEGNAYCQNNFVDQEVRSKTKNGDWRLMVENDLGLFQ